MSHAAATELRAVDPSRYQVLRVLVGEGNPDNCCGRSSDEEGDAGQEPGSGEELI